MLLDFGRLVLPVPKPGAAVPPLPWTLREMPELRAWRYMLLTVLSLPRSESVPI